MKKLLFVLLFIAILSPFCIIMPDDFSVSRLIQNAEEKFSSFDFSQIEKITKKPLKYLGQGMQSIAFVTEDDRYVLKFFLKKRLHQKLRIRAPYFLRKKKSKPKNRIDVLRRYDLAFQKIPEQTGLLAVHLSSTNTDLPHCYVIYNGTKHLIDLNAVSFVIQHRGDCLDKTFPLLTKREKKQAKKALEKLLIQMAKKGFINQGKSFNQENFALLVNRAIMIDIGNVSYSSNQIQNPDHEIKKVTTLLENWASAKIPNRS